MSRQLKKLLLNPWVVTVGAALLVDALIDIGIIRFVRAAIGGAFRLVQWLLQSRVAVWQITLLFAAAGVAWRLSHVARHTRKNRPVFLNYTTDTFDQIPYRWSYERLDAGCRIGRIAAHCPSCNCEIVRMQCPRCKVVYFANKDRAQLIALIRHGIGTRFATDGFTAVSE